MPKRSRRRRSQFLSPYRLDDTYLRRPDRKYGRPGILSGIDDHGNPVLVKIWPKAKHTSDSELREIWHHEVRQLHRLGGYPNAFDAIATLQQTGFDDDGFYLVLDPGQRKPLSSVLAHASSIHWIKNQRVSLNRAKLWRNLLRISTGLETLHTQGLLHKNLDNWAILTTGGEEPDFQLTGFEWSIRLIGAAAGRRSARGPDSAYGEQVSFLQDWRDFGRLAAELMNLSVCRLEDPKIPLSAVSENLVLDEIRLLRHLVQVEHLDRLDGEVVERRIQEVLRVLEADIAHQDVKFHLVVSLGTNSRLSQNIREASEDVIEITSDREQIEFIEDDLSEVPILFAIRIGDGSNFRLAIRGTKLIYRIKEYSPRSEGAALTWELAYCDSVELQSPNPNKIVDSIPLQSNSLEILQLREAHERFSRMRGKVRSWDTLRRVFKVDKKFAARDKQHHKAFAITQFLEALYAATDAFPVNVRNVTGNSENEMNAIMITVREDLGREALAKEMGFKSPSIRLNEALMQDRRSDEWVLTEAQHVGKSEFTDTSWRFDKEFAGSKKAPEYRFVGTDLSPPLHNPILIPGDFVGRDKQLQRRLKALRALADHAELLWMLVDPRRRILDTHDSIDNGNVLANLDDSKIQALNAIVETLPLFLVQGPPGVGKTHMIRELVKYIFEKDPTTRLLLSAQSNAAVNHLMETLDKALVGDRDDILIVRCRPRDSHKDAGPYEIGSQVGSIIQRFAQSELVSSSPDNLRESVMALKAELSGDDTNDENLKGRGVAPRYSKQAVEGLIVRAANVVFATTNSFELERLIEERGQFDWSIIEEAGKATGGELVAPLLLSYRRLMIGDHKQLSPFGSEQIIRLLEEPDTLRNAMITGKEFVSRTLRDPSTDEILDEIDEEAGEDFAALCATAIDCLLLFESLIEAEFKLYARGAKARQIAHRLNQQHRMHPAIARVISRCFYDGDLHTHPSAKKRFEKEPCPIKSLDPKRLPDAPIMMIDMPYVQSTVGMLGAEAHPRWHNPDEIEAILKAVMLIGRNPKSSEIPTMAILSPYREQVIRLQNRIDEDSSVGSHLSQFCAAVSPGNYCGTVDSFQGNEADVVVVSLVRNNHHSGIRSALGFLSDSRRMNVLLSRARWRLILVCSSKFLEHVLRAEQFKGERCNTYFLSEMLKAIEDERKNSNAVVVPSDRLLRLAR
ncbi:AAA domain-containing protein [Limibacillus halophilus]|uniref:DNA polymerase III delta prime subunit n=1 Tax=Limibacillus halophilus TaxID=1579333 RepID=A0A839SXU3_9PROT|nr:AAA domain-containing protein [Limibacillus halophilus]MBB3065773.1 DNA polymerase III delta prime subunit [Limibacillus halophilus]